jgi:hypothetical protein
VVGWRGGAWGLRVEDGCVVRGEADLLACGAVREGDCVGLLVCHLCIMFKRRIQASREKDRTAVAKQEKVGSQ